MSTWAGPSRCAQTSKLRGRSITMDFTVTPAKKLTGRIRVPGDKSISHRAALIGSVATGVTTVRGFLRADDCLHTLSCLRDLGVEITEHPDRVVVRGSGGRLRAPGRVLDAGNSGTTIRLLAGILAGQPFTAELDGDESLRRRPMDRVAEPLRKMGAHVGAREGRYPPLRILGAQLRGITYHLPVASAQVKSAVLLAGVLADGETSIVEPVPTRDHTERMLAACGVRIRRSDGTITITPGTPVGRELVVPGDLSSAAFLLAAAAARPGSEVVIDGVGLNPTRTGVLDVLRAMGADVAVHAQEESSGEPVGTVIVRGRELRGVTIGGTMIPRVIDELPVLCVAAAIARGRTLVTDAAELRVKESDRIGVLARGLRTLGIQVEERPDGIAIAGGHLRGGRVDSEGDHRVAMAFAVAGLLADDPVAVDGAESVAVSFPGFFEALEAITKQRD